MTTNLLLPTGADDLANALFDAAPANDERWREAVVRRLAQELRSNPAHAAAVRTLPSFAPAWAAERPVHHLLPAPHLHGEVEVLTRALARAAAPPPGLRTRDSTLAARCDALLPAFEHERWPALAARAAELDAALDALAVDDRVRRRHKRRLRTPATVPSVAGRSWRRAPSIAALLELSRGTRWCLTKDDDLAQDYLERFVEGALTFWTLHGRDGAVAALLSHDVDGALEEFRTVHNHPAVEHRADVLRLVRAGEVNLDWGGMDTSLLAIDSHLGRRGQPYIEDVLSGRGCVTPIRYRLWSDGRRRRYLLTTGPDGRGVPKTWLRLDASPKLAHQAKLSGAVELAWTGTQSALMNAALANAFPKVGRPAHVVRAMRFARAMW